MENKPQKKPSGGGNVKDSPEPGAVDDRRGFVTKAAAVVCGGAVAVAPMAAGVAVFFDPLMHKGTGGRKVRVASLSALPADGIPRQFPVIVESRDDAWNRFHNEPIGSVFLLREAAKPDDVIAFNATCPHAGCFVAFKPDPTTPRFACPCHESAFDLQGKPTFGPSPRALDSLTCEVVNDDIFVTFQEFYTGIQEKKPKT